MAAGASALFSKDGLQKFSREIRSLRGRVLESLGGRAAEGVKKEQKKRVADAMSQMGSMLAGGAPPGARK